ncbi:MAG: hypothetical protein RIQ56_601, partial [Candidatus Parcubacteria bacterium]
MWSQKVPYTVAVMDLTQTLVLFFGILNLSFAFFLFLNSNRNFVILLYALISVFAVLWTSSTIVTGLKGISIEMLSWAVYGHYIFGYLAYLSFFCFAFYYPTKPKKYSTLA